MRTAEEMLCAVHERARTLRRRQTQRLLTLAGASGCVLTAALAALIGSLGGLRHQALSADYAAASLLSNNAGGYVLAAVVAFMAGVVVTILCKKNKS